MAADEPEPSIASIVPQAGSEGLLLLARVGRVDPTSLADYRASGGFDGLGTALAMGREAVIAEVTASRLLGRGGAAFPTGRKWGAVAGQPAQPHYLVCNADESEPGTFKDRVLMERDPFALVEGMAIEAFATGATKGFIYLRGEYPTAAERVGAAIAAARADGILGPDAFGPGDGFDIELRRGAGAYICGEETALFESIEGGRGEPRNKPPFPVEVGLFGKPTAINNVETLVNVPLILRDGGRGVHRDRDRGLDRPEALLPERSRRPTRHLRGPVRDDSARAPRPGRRGARRSGHPGDPARRRGRHVRRARRDRRAS